MIVQFGTGHSLTGERLNGIGRTTDVAEYSDGLVAISGRPRFESMSDVDSDIARSILTRYRETGPEFLAELRGEFAIGIQLFGEDRILLAIDRMGIERIAWSLVGDLLTFGSSVTQVAASSPIGEAVIDPQSLFNFMLCHMIPAPDTIFSGVSKLKPATALEFRGNQMREIRYWNPDFERAGRFDETAARRQVLPLLENAVKNTGIDSDTGAFLSGGLDSSTVTGVLGDALQAPAKAFSIGFGIKEFDEMEFARTASDRFGCQHHAYDVSADDIVEMMPRIAARFDEPFGNSSVVPTFACARLARENGVTHLLAGDGGDELFGGNERYTKQTVFEWYGRLPQVLRASIMEPLAMALDPETAPFLMRKYSSYVRQASIPLPDRFESWNLIYREGPRTVFSPDFLGTVRPDQPLELMRSVWNACESDNLLDKMLWYDWKFTLADNDLRKVRTMCELAGVRVSFPMLDESFVDLSISVPPDIKIRRGELRAFFKSVVRTYLPGKIISKTKHGFGLPFGDWLKTHAGLQDLVYGLIEGLKHRSIFNVEFLDRVIQEHKSGHAGYYGYAIWDLAMLEQWLATHGSDFGT